MHRPSQSWSWTKSAASARLGAAPGGHLAIRAGCVFRRDNLAEHVALNEDKTADGGHETRIPILRAFSVFHASQVDGIPALAPSVAAKTVPERMEDAETILLHPEGRFRPRPSGSVPGLTARQCLQSQLQPYHPPFIQSGGLRARPTPERRAGNDHVTRLQRKGASERIEMRLATENTMSVIDASCTIAPLSLVCSRRPAQPGGNSSAVTK